MADLEHQDEQWRKGEQGRQHRHEGVGHAGTPGKRSLTEGLSRPSHGPLHPAGRGGIELPEGLRGAGQQVRESEAGDGTFGAEPGAALAGASRGLRVSPVRFDRVAVGDDGEQRLELENLSARQVRIVNWTMEGEDASDFEVRLPRLFDLSAGGRFWGGVRFRPTAGGERRARLSIQSDLPGTITTVDLIGQSDDKSLDETGTAPVAQQPPAAAGQVDRPKSSTARGTSDLRRGPQPLDPQIDYGTAPRLPVRPPVSSGLVPLTDKQRASLLRLTHAEIDKAYTAFVSACKDQQQSIASAAKANAEFMALVVEVAFGALMPNIVGSMSNAIVGALQGERPNGQTLSAISDFVSNRDNLKSLATAAAKETARRMKKASGTWVVDGTGGFITLLEVQFQAAFTEIDEAIEAEGVPDATIIAVWAAFHPSVANKLAYAAIVNDLVHRYQKQVAPVGIEMKNGSSGIAERQHETRVFRLMMANGTERFALVRREIQLGLLPGNTELKFVSWIEPEFLSMAIGRTTAIDRAIETVPASEVEL